MNRFNNVVFGQKAFVVNAKKQVLVLKRKQADLYTGYWDIPGGKLDDTDTLQEALAREIKEETGLTLDRVVLQLSTSKFIGEVADKPVVLRNIYLCTATGEVKLSFEHSEYRWVEAHELSELAFPSDPDLQAALLKVAEVLAGLDLGHKYSLVF